MDQKAREQANRAFNLTVTAVLFFAGVAFAGVAFGEKEPLDQIDDSGLLLIGLIAAGWYLWHRHRYLRSAVPLALTVIATAFQLLAIPIEHDDTAAFGDNIGGSILYVSFLLFVVYQYLRPPRE